VEEVQASIDRMMVQLGVLKNLNSTWEKGRYLAGLSGYYSADALSGLKTQLSAETDGSPANEKEQQRSGIELRFIDPFIKDMNEKLRFAQIELDLLKKQAADREPVRITFFGAMSGVFEFKPSDRMTLSQAVVQIGTTDRVNLKAVTLHRKGALGGQDVITLDVSKLLKSGDPKADLELQNGDRIEFHEKTF
jgi:hypothetical protein